MYSQGRPVGRDSTLVTSMSRSANTLSALNSEPGVLGSVKTTVVFSGWRPPMQRRRRRRAA